MKKYIIVLFSLLALSTSCTDYLDKQPDDMKTDEMVWSSRMETEKYLANCYGGIPTGHLHQHEPWVGAADECNITWNFYQADNFNRVTGPLPANWCVIDTLVFIKLFVLL